MRLISTIFTASLLGLGMFVMTGCNKDAQSEEKKVEAPIPVEAHTVELGDITAFYASTATLEAQDEATVAAKAGGIVTAIFVEEGDVVTAGQPLAQLDTERLKLEAERNKAQLIKLESELDRAQLLHEKRLISADAYDKLKFEVDSLKAMFYMAELELKNATIAAPIDGVVAERFIKVGNMVELNAPTFHITDFDPLHAILHVPEKELSKLKVGQPAQVQADARSDQVFAGTIKRISPVVDPSSGTFKVTVEVLDPAHQLKPGMFGRVSVVYDVHKAARLLPKDALLAEDNVNTVFIVKNGVAYRQTVETGFTNERFIEVVSGLEPGDMVITAGHSSLKDKTKVEMLKL